eukprot:scaffold306094_cov24-Tisochrysis_lutea.AAC.1
MAEREASFVGLAKELADNEEIILKELIDCQGSPVDIGAPACERNEALLRPFAPRASPTGHFDRASLSWPPRTSAKPRTVVRACNGGSAPRPLQAAIGSPTPQRHPRRCVPPRPSTRSSVTDSLSCHESTPLSARCICLHWRSRGVHLCRLVGAPLVSNLIKAHTKKS